MLNQPQYKGAEILVARANFGSGSSREHAVWALQDYGFRAVIAPSFADIFFNNCGKNGLLTIILKPEEVDAIFQSIAKHPGYKLSVDLAGQTVSDHAGWSAHFDIAPAFQARAARGPRRCGADAGARRHYRHLRAGASSTVSVSRSESPPQQLGSNPFARIWGTLSSR